MVSCFEERTLQEIYLPGRLSPPGRYRELGSGRIVQLDQEDLLPTSLDGRVACYVLQPAEWGQLRQSVVSGELLP